MAVMFVILQKYDFSSKSQLYSRKWSCVTRCLWYCKSTIFQANHNRRGSNTFSTRDVCDTAKVRFFKQITTRHILRNIVAWMFVILQKYDFSSKSQRCVWWGFGCIGCLWYCKSTIFQANHNICQSPLCVWWMFVILQKYDFSSKSQRPWSLPFGLSWCLWYCKSTIFQANHNASYI